MTTTNGSNGSNEFKGEEIAEMSVGGWSGRGTLSSLVGELERQKTSKLDFCLDARTIAIEVASGGALDGSIVMFPLEPQAAEFLPSAGMPVSERALLQIGERVSPNVPAKFLRELINERPKIAASLLTQLLRATGKRNLVRCLDGKVRAFLSDQYRILDNFDLAFGSLDVARDVGGEVFEAALSDTNMRIKFTSRAVWDVVDGIRQGDKGNWYAGGLGNQKFLSKVAARTMGELPGGPGTVHPAVTISNSETGHGGLNVRISILAGICFNLATIETVASRVHLGDKLDVGIYTAETQSSDSKTIMLKCRDAIKAAFNPDTFKALVAKCKLANADVIHAPTTAVGNLVEISGLSEAAKDGILAHFLADYKPTRFGLAQAVARYAQDVVDPDVAADLEILTGKVITDSKTIGANVPA